MDKHRYSRVHSRLHGLARMIKKKLNDAETPGLPMSKRERNELEHILSVMNTILAEDIAEAGMEMPCRNSNQYLNTQCEFFDLNANRIQCAIGCDMYHCSRKCIYATNVPGALPPYCTKYMKGRL